MMDNNERVSVAATPARKAFEELYANGIRNCSRCRGNHDHVKMKPFTFPGEQWTHFGMCPTKHEPILFRVIEATSELEATC